MLGREIVPKRKNSVNDPETVHFLSTRREAGPEIWPYGHPSGGRFFPLIHEIHELELAVDGRLCAGEL